MKAFHGCETMNSTRKKGILKKYGDERNLIAVGARMNAIHRSK
jgi:hypothetical protein